MAPGKEFPKLEFKSGDDAWYDVSIELAGSYLKVHYEEFGEEDDEKLPLEEEFQTVEDVRSRFRFSSKQLQDHHCEEVKEGLGICACCSSNGEDNRFFDAVVEQVHRSKHHLVDGEEQCTCTFRVLWKAGPVANQRAPLFCENICLLTPGSIETHPVTNALLRLVEKNLDSRTQSDSRNHLRRKRTNTKGLDTTNFANSQAQPGERTDERHMSCETPNRGDEVFMSNEKEVSDSPGSISSQSKEKEKKFEEVCATENVLTSYEVLLQERAASDNELKSSVESDFDVGSETNISRSSRRCTTLKEDGIFSKITSLEGENAKDFLLPEAAALSLQNKNFQHEIVPKNSKEVTVDAEILNECMETNLNMGRKEQKPILPDLNSLPVDLEAMHPSTGSVSLAMGYTYTVGIKANTADQKFRELDDSAVIIENVRPCHSGWLEEEDSDNLIKDSTDHNVVCNGIDNSGRINKQLIMGENQKGQEIIEDKNGEKLFLASWGRGKRHKHRNEMLVSESLVQENSQKDEDIKTLKNFLQPTDDFDRVDNLGSSLTTSSSKLLNPNEPLHCYRDERGIQGQTGAVDNKSGEFINDAIDASKSSCLTSSMKPIKRKDLFDSFTDLSGRPEQPMKKVHIDMCAPRHKQVDCESGPLEIPGAVVISSDDENDHPFPRKECDNGCNSDLAHLQKAVHATVYPVSKFGFVKRESCKRTKEDKMYHTSMYKGNINEPGIKEDHYYCTCGLNYQKNISVTQDQCFLSEKYNFSPSGSDYANTPLNWKVDLQSHCFHSNSKYCEQPSHGHMNEPGIMEDKPFCTYLSKGQKNVSVTQHQCNGHSLSEKWNHCPSGGPSHGKGDLPKFCFRSTSKECELPRHDHLSTDLEVEEREFSLSEVLVLDNLETDISHSDVIKVMSTMACGIVQVYIFPCLKCEKFTRGFVWFKDHTSLMKAYALLQDGNFFIVSSDGRPWVVTGTEGGICEGIFGGFTVNLQGSKLPSFGTSASEKVDIVHKGERAYEKAKRRKDAFLEYRKGLTSLQRRLEHEEM